MTITDVENDGADELQLFIKESGFGSHITITMKRHSHEKKPANVAATRVTCW